MCGESLLCIRVGYAIFIVLRTQEQHIPMYIFPHIFVLTHEYVVTIMKTLAIIIIIITASLPPLTHYTNTDMGIREDPINSDREIYVAKAGVWDETHRRRKGHTKEVVRKQSTDDQLVSSGNITYPQDGTIIPWGDTVNITVVIGNNTLEWPVYLSIGGTRVAEYWEPGTYNYTWNTTEWGEGEYIVELYIIIDMEVQVRKDTLDRKTYYVDRFPPEISVGVLGTRIVVDGREWVGGDVRLNITVSDAIGVDGVEIYYWGVRGDGIDPCATQDPPLEGGWVHYMTIDVDAGEYSYPVPIDLVLEENTSFLVVAYDYVGHESNMTTDWLWLDTKPPTISILEPEDGLVTNGETNTVNFTARDEGSGLDGTYNICLLYTSPSPRDS